MTRRSQDTCNFTELRDLALQALGLSWGPVGSVGFELATAFPAANCSSDLDLIIRVSDALVPRLAEKVVEAIEDAGTRVDVLLETAAGAIALAEYVRSGPNLLLRTVNGPRLVASGYAGNSRCFLERRV